MTVALQLRRLLTDLIQAVVPSEFADAAKVEAGVRELEAIMVRIGVEAHEANACGLSFSQAADDFGTFPTLHRVHNGVRDMLTVVLDNQVVAHMERLLAMPSPPIAEGVLLSLGRFAGSTSEAPVLVAAAQFWLLQAVRLNVIVAEMIGDGSIAEVGGLRRDLDQACEDEVRWWITEGSNRACDVMPLRILVVSALKNLQDRLGDVKDVIAQLGAAVRAEVAEECARRATIELMLREMAASDGLLLRNEPEIAGELGEQRVDLQRLIDTHPIAFDNVNRGTAYVRAQRVRERLLDEKPLERRGTDLIDLLRNHLKRGA